MEVLCTFCGEHTTALPNLVDGADSRGNGACFFGVVLTYHYPNAGVGMAGAKADGSRTMQKLRQNSSLLCS